MHYFFVIWLQYLLLSAPLWGFAKGVTVAAATLGLSWAVAAAPARMMAPGRAGFQDARRPSEAAVPEKP